MKKIKFAMAFVAAAQMSTSQVAFAASQTQQYNRIEVSDLQLSYLSEDYSFKDLYERHSAGMTPQNKALLGAWVAEFGNEKIPTLSTERSKTDAGVDVLTVTATKFGKTYTFKMSADKLDSIEINGQKTSMDSLASVTPKADTFLTPQQFAALTPKEKVIYLQKFREALEAAELVNKASKTKLGQQAKPANYSLLNLLFGSSQAWALPQVGQQCIVAGNSGLYQPTKAGGLSCFPSYDEVASKVQPKCGGSKQVACNPLVYGLSSTGEPYCLDSSNRGQFTASATAQCNAKSPLGEEGTEERNQAYERILKSYFIAKNGDDKASEIASCFNKDSKVKANSQCEKWFTGQISSFDAFLKDTLKECDGTLKEMEDQKSACSSLKQRALGLSTYSDSLLAGFAVIDKSERAPASEVVAADAEKAAIIKGEKTTLVTEKKVEKKKDRGGMWFWLIGAGLLAMLLLKKNKAVPPTVAVAAPVVPTVTPGVDATTITLKPQPMDACKEFGSCPVIPATPMKGAR